MSTFLLLGQPVVDSVLVQKKMEAVRLPDMNQPCEGDNFYIVSTYSPDGEVAFLIVQDTVFSLLPTVCPVPTVTPEWGRIQYDRPAIVDRAARRAYLVGHDTTERAYVVSVEYDKRPAPLTLYYTDPLKDFDFSTPVLTPDGDLIIAGGLAHDNFSPFSAVWLLPVSGCEASEVYAMMAAPMEESHSNNTIRWVLGGLLLFAVVAIAITIALRRFASLRGGTTKQSRNDPSSLPRFARKSGFDNAKRVNDEPIQESVPTEQIEQPEQSAPEPRLNPTLDGLMARIIQLMETERLYLNPELKLSDVADALGVHRNILSACINAQGSSFNQMVNDYRVQRAKELLSQATDMKMATIGLKSGFANERTFYRVFKDATGQTPKEYAQNN